jgi:hypothetical protein
MRPSNNDEKYIQILETLDPSLFRIKMALQETGVNPDLIPRIVRVLGNLDIGTGYGEITILMKQRIITQIKSNESDVLNMPVDNKQ